MRKNKFLSVPIQRQNNEHRNNILPKNDCPKICSQNHGITLIEILVILVILLMLLGLLWCDLPH